MEWIWIGVYIAIGIVVAVVAMVLLALIAGSAWALVSKLAEWVGLR